MTVRPENSLLESEQNENIQEPQLHNRISDVMFVKAILSNALQSSYPEKKKKII